LTRRANQEHSCIGPQDQHLLGIESRLGVFKAWTHKSRRLGSRAFDVRYAPDSGAKADIAACSSRATEAVIRSPHRLPRAASRGRSTKAPLRPSD
jgi:hypothetical protein